MSAAIDRTRVLHIEDPAEEYRATQWAITSVASGLKDFYRRQLLETELAIRLKLMELGFEQAEITEFWPEICRAMRNGDNP